MTQGFFLTNDAFPQIIKPCTETRGNTAAICVRGRRRGHAHQLQSGSMLANLHAVSTEQPIYPLVHTNSNARSFQCLWLTFLGYWCTDKHFFRVSHRMIHECLCQLRILIWPFLGFRGDIRFGFQTCSDVFDTLRAPSLIIQGV